MPPQTSPKKKKSGGPPPRPSTTRVPIGVLLRMFLLGSVAVVASAYALWRYLTVPRPPLLVPAPAPTEIPAPELEPEPPASR